METGMLEVADCPISWWGGGEARDDAIVLVHGNRANRHWWDAAVDAGLARDGRRIVAVDLSGHGDSGWRQEYSPELWADEVLTAIDEVAGARATIVGHSMGGLVGIVAAARGPDLVTGLVLVDTGIRLSDPQTALEPRGTPARAARTFDSRAAAIQSVRLFPRQPVFDPAVLRRVAEHSIGLSGGKWTWKFDPAVARRFTDASINRHLAEVHCPVAMVNAEESALVDRSSRRAAETILGRGVPETLVADAHHHLVLDRPAVAAEAIARAIADWSPNSLNISLTYQTIVW